MRDSYKNISKAVPAGLRVPMLIAASFAVAASVYAQAGDVLAPAISKVEIKDISPYEATVLWQTDEDADSTINYSLDKQYGIVRDPLPNKRGHKLVLTNLDPSTTYHFRIVSSDVAGNQAISGDFSITTAAVQDIEGAENIEDPSQRALAEKAVTIIEKITDPDALRVVSDSIKEVAKGVTSQLTIIGTPRVEPDTTTAIVTWTTDRPSVSSVAFVPDRQYDANDPNTYRFVQSSNGDYTQVHRLQIIGLEPATLYHLQAIATDEFGIEGRSTDVEFTTKSLLPTIQNLRIAKVEETAATLAWRTTVPAGAVVEYQNLSTREKRSVGNPSLIVDHSIRLADLKLGTHYEAVVIAENQAGDRVKSPPIRFVTVKDVSPPEVSKVTNESTLFPESDAKIQTIIGWETDELTQCDLFYHEGLVLTGEEEKLPREDEGYNEKHVRVIVDFRPATVYKFWVTCADSSGNATRSEDFVLFTPQKEKSIIDIILENFEGTFGWVKGVGN